MSEDFSHGRRGQILKTNPNKVRITIRLDGDIVDHFKNIVHEAGGGNYQTLINDSLRSFIESEDSDFNPEAEANRWLVKEVRKAVRDEFRAGRQNR